MAVRRRGLMAEILGGLTLVMIAATAVLAVMLSRHHEEEQRELLARALSLEALSVGPPRALVSDLVWWRVGRDGRAMPWGAHGASLDPDSRTIALRALEVGAPLLSGGTIFGDVRFAMPIARGAEAAVARVPAAALPGGGAAGRLVALAILLADAVIFIGFGASLLRERIVVPLRRLGAAARRIADGEGGARLPVEGARETAEVAVAFNEMSDALEARTEALEKAVAELRGTNRELREAQAGLARAERLAAVGRLSAGVAHEVGNPMGALLALLDLAGRDPGLSPASREHLRKAAAQVERVRKILRQMLDLSRSERREGVPLDLAAVAEETAALLRAQAGGRSIAVETSRADEAVPPALGDPAAVMQILLNLGLNALDAVAGRTEARIVLRVEPAILRRRAGDRDGTDAGARRSADAVACIVEDNGPGVRPDDRERIFDPFFTTRPPGQGTGLGLSSAALIAEELGGSLELEPSASGARFVLKLPAAACEAACEVRNELRRPEPRPLPRKERESQD